MFVVACVLLASSVVGPAVGTEARTGKRIRRRISGVLRSIDADSFEQLGRRNQEQMTGLERAFDSFPGMSSFRQVIEQSGLTTKVHSVLLTSLLLAGLALGLFFFLTGNILLAAAIALIAATFPIVRVFRARAKRIGKFEEQLPEALDLMSRALMAGHPFNETLKMVSDEMSDPIAGEFERVFLDINYGIPLKTAFMGLLSRVPTISLNTLVIAILVQNESGGRIAEILQKISEVIRSRFRLNRKVRTLSAEGRMSAWILTLLPFVLALVISITTPSYLPKMLKDPTGINMVLVAFGLVILGILWMRKIIRFKF